MDCRAMTDQQFGAITSYETDLFSEEERALYLAENIKRGRTNVLFDPNETVEFYGMPDMKIVHVDMQHIDISA